MATITKGRTFVSGEVVTPSKLNTLVDSATLSAIQLADLSSLLQQYLVPAGAVQAFAMNSAPAGWLAADGALVLRATYSALWTSLGTTSSPYGQGDGSTTFQLPDLRGYFVRGAGQNSDTTASGTFGAKQADAFKSHAHSVTDPTHAHAFSDYYQSTAVATAFEKIQSASDAGRTYATGGSDTGLTTAGATDYRATGITIGDTGGTETRPRNIPMLYCIKF